MRIYLGQTDKIWLIVSTFDGSEKFYTDVEKPKRKGTR